MAIADRENVVTGLLAWLLGDSSPLQLDRRVAILAAIVGDSLPGVCATRTRTEHQDIDLIVTCTLAGGAGLSEQEIRRSASDFNCNTRPSRRSANRSRTLHGQEKPSTAW